MDFLDSFNSMIQPLFEICGFEYAPPESDAESSEYHACSFRVNGRSVRYRKGKITPTKVGQFITLWKRIGKNPIQPYDSRDDVDLLVVTVETKNRCGQFIFPKSALVKHGVFSVNGKGGKRALRVYSPWDKVESRQAQKTQNWQSDFFIEISKNKSLDVLKFKSLYSA